jgi:hypothetical protein
MQRAHETALDLVGREPVERPEPAESGQRQVAAARRRQLADLDLRPPGKRRPLDVHPVRAMRGEVGGRERRRRAPGDGAAVEAVEILQHRRQLGLHQRPVDEEDAARVGIRREVLAHPGRHPPESRRALDAVARHGDGGRGQRGERPRSETSSQRLPSRDRARHRRRADPAHRHPVGRTARRRRQPARGDEPVHCAVGPHHRQQIPADAAHVGIGDRQHQVRGDGRVDGIAAVAQHGEPRRGRCRQRRAHGVTREARHPNASSPTAARAA